ncbi:hypothetical protein FPOAC1_007724 [Fusarium poae]|uniref:hypothetical protein n=1 Tax=Fusarium poae TaxID=36050 RepID=UPI001CE7499D|nr:hypothetical protein FPOAC1_007724 [Fusarium poae]KAG8668345.1 hypothetical protein FPOAC1_007724 [Fusarium poae]
MTPKSKRVTAEHTRDRVRDNQRRHRARRKDYIATLEEKLSDAEKTISTLRGQVADLEEAIKRDNDGRISTLPRVEPEDVDIQEESFVIDTDDLIIPITGFVTESPGEINDPSYNDLSGLNIESTDLTLPILQPAMFPPPSQTGHSPAYQSYQNNNDLQQNQLINTTNTCCSPPIPPIGTELSAELTRLCCEAYILIAQSNTTLLNENNVTLLETDKESKHTWFHSQQTAQKVDVADIDSPFLDQIGTGFYRLMLHM